MKRLPICGTLVEVDWDDICGFINSDLSEAKPAPCITTGRIMLKADNFLVIGTSVFKPAKGEREPHGDWVAIPYGTIRHVKRL